MVSISSILVFIRCVPLLFYFLNLTFGIELTDKAIVNFISVSGYVFPKDQVEKKVDEMVAMIHDLEADLHLYGDPKLHLRTPDWKGERIEAQLQHAAKALEDGEVLKSKTSIEGIKLDDVLEITDPEAFRSRYDKANKEQRPAEHRKTQAVISSKAEEKMIGSERKVGNLKKLYRELEEVIERGAIHGVPSLGAGSREDVRTEKGVTVEAR